MLNSLFLNPLGFIFYLVALLVALTIHEASHAWVADRLGDPTARLQGRISLNPLVHIDLYGAMFLLFFGFGWGKPVQFDPYNLKNPKKDGALISLAGPIANMILAIILSVVLRFTSNPFSPLYFLTNIFGPVIVLNVALAVFNLIPIHPLDGGKILVGILPDKDAHELDMFLQRYGIFILFLLIFPFAGVSPISSFISPIMNFFLKILLPSSPTL